VAPAAEPIEFPAALQDIAAEASAPRLRSFAERCRHEEGVARCPFVLLQAVALAKQFQCLHPPPEAQRPRARYARRLKTFVWEFYSSAPKFKWRGKLALVLFELQQMGHAETLQQMLNAMARVHVSTLERLLRGLWLPSNPLLLVRTLEEVAAQNLSCQAVFAMVTQSDVRALKQQPPTSPAETEAAVTALLLHAASQPAASGTTPTVAQGSTTATRRSKRKRRVVVTESGDHRDAELQETYADDGGCEAPAAA